MLGRLDERTVLILEQTTKTNGRITRLEERVDFLEQNRAAVDGEQQVKKAVFARVYDFGEKFLVMLGGILIGRLIK